MSKNNKDTKNKETKLTLRQQKFIDNYIKTGNKSKSAIEAGYNPKNARSQGVHLSTNPNVLARLQQLQGKAVDVIDRMLDGGDEEHSVKDETQLRAAQDVLDRTGLPKNVKLDQEVNNTNINIDVRDLDDKQLNELYSKLLK